jgi:hypothetical protein
MIGGGLGIISMIFAAMNSLKKPQEVSEINDAVFDEKFKGITDKFDTRFQDMKDGVVKIMQNDIQEVKSDLRGHIQSQSIYERETACKLGGIDAKLDILIKK